MFHDYEIWLRSWGAAQQTIESRMSALRVAAALWAASPLTVTTAELQAWLASPEFRPWTRTTYFSHLRSLFGWMVQTGRRPDDPTLAMRRPREPGSSPKPLNPIEVRQIMATAPARTAEFFTLAIRQGLRAHEIAKLRCEDVGEASLFVLGKGGKEAWLPTHPEVWALAQTRPRVGWWFPHATSGGPISRASVSHAAHKVLSDLGIPGSIHRGRHTFATELLRAGVNIRAVQKLMRHSSLATTEAYLDVTGDELRDAIRTLVA